MKTYSDYVAKVQQLMLDSSYMTSQTDAEAALATAVSTLAQYRLNVFVEEYTATGERLYDLPDDWDNEQGRYDIEYPVDDTADEVQFLDVEMSDIYRVPLAVSATGLQLRFRDKNDVSNGSFVPASGQLFRFHYGIPYVCTGTISPPTSTVTIPDSLFEAVSKLGGRELCLILSIRMAQNASQVNAGGLVDFSRQQDPLQKLADTFFKDFLRRVSPNKGEVPGMAIFGSFEETPLHRYARTLYPRDNSLRGYTDR